MKDKKMIREKEIYCGEKIHQKVVGGWGAWSGMTRTYWVKASPIQITRGKNGTEVGKYYFPPIK